MTRTFACTLSLAVALATQRIPAAAFTPQVHLRSGAEVVALTVTVTDRADKHIGGLTERDFVVVEDGVPQPLSFFASGQVPLDVAIIMDTSDSMGRDLRIVQEAACGLARTLRAGDRASVVEVKSGSRVAQPLTEDVSSIQAAIRRTAVGGSTALYDGLYSVLKELSRQRSESPDIRRRTLVVLSDGADNASHVEFDDVLDLARRVGVGMYIISPKSLPGRVVFASEYQQVSRVQYSMKTLAREAGGLIFFPGTSRDLEGVYGAIASELANQYELGYVPANPARDGRFRRVSVQVVSRTDARARTRAGYFADASALERARPWDH